MLQDKPLHRSSMRILILALIGLISYLIVVVPGYFLFVPVNPESEDTMETVAKDILKEPGKEPVPK